MGSTTQQRYVPGCQTDVTEAATEVLQTCFLVLVHSYCELVAGEGAVVRGASESRHQQQPSSKPIGFERS